MKAYFQRKKTKLKDLKEARDRGETRAELIKRAKRGGLTELALIREGILEPR